MREEDQVDTKGRPNDGIPLLRAFTALLYATCFTQTPNLVAPQIDCGYGGRHYVSSQADADASLRVSMLRRHSLLPRGCGRRNRDKRALPASAAASPSWGVKTSPATADARLVSVSAPALRIIEGSLFVSHSKPIERIDVPCPRYRGNAAAHPTEPGFAERGRGRFSHRRGAEARVVCLQGG